MNKNKFYDQIRYQPHYQIRSRIVNQVNQNIRIHLVNEVLAPIPSGQHIPIRRQIADQICENFKIK